MFWRRWVYCSEFGRLPSIATLWQIKRVLSFSNCAAYASQKLLTETNFIVQLLLFFFIFRKQSENKLQFVLDNLKRRIRTKKLEAQHQHGGSHPSLEVRVKMWKWRKERIMFWSTYDALFHPHCNYFVCCLVYKGSPNPQAQLQGLYWCS